MEEGTRGARAGPLHPGTCRVTNQSTIVHTRSTHARPSNFPLKLNLQSGGHGGFQSSSSPRHRGFVAAKLSIASLQEVLITGLVCRKASIIHFLKRCNIDITWPRLLAMFRALEGVEIFYVLGGGNDYLWHAQVKCISKCATIEHTRFCTVAANPSHHFRRFQKQVRYVGKHQILHFLQSCKIGLDCQPCFGLWRELEIFMFSMGALSLA